MTGRELPPSSPFAADDGSADPAVAVALAAVGAGTGTTADVVAALAGTRVLVPVLAELESEGTVVVGGHEHTVDKEASAGIVALQAPDGRTALPVFSSVVAMSAWRGDARPVPTDVARAALSAVSEGWELVVLDPGGPVTVLLPRPAVWALAQAEPWRPAVVGAGEDRRVDDAVRAAVRAAVAGAVPVADPGSRDGSAAAGGTEPAPVAAGPATAPVPAPRRGLARLVRRRDTPGPGPTVPAAAPVAPVRSVDAAPGRRAEVAVELTVVPGLDRAELQALLGRVGEALAADETVTRRVDSIELRVR